MQHGFYDLYLTQALANQCDGVDGQRITEEPISKEEFCHEFPTHVAAEVLEYLRLHDEKLQSKSCISKIENYTYSLRTSTRVRMTFRPPPCTRITRFPPHCSIGKVNLLQRPTVLQVKAISTKINWVTPSCCLSASVRKIVREYQHLMCLSALSTM